MKSSIYVNGISVYAKHGVFKEENILGQKFIFDIECQLDYRLAMKNDDLAFSVSYGHITELVYQVASENTYKLLEKLSYEIIREIFEKFAIIEKVSLTINKPNAPIEKIFSSCGTKIEMTRDEFEVL